MKIVPIEKWPRPTMVYAICDGRREADITAFIVALAVEHLLVSAVLPGVHYIDEVLECGVTIEMM